jgi:hypothetical protein
MIRNQRYRRLQLESLEPRLALAGNVSVGVSGGHLTILGDAAYNQITIQATAVAGQFVVVGQDTSTTINGGVAPVTVSGVTGNATIAMGGGYDVVHFDTAPAAIRFQGNVTIDMGRDVEPVWGFHQLNILGGNEFSVGASLHVIAGYRALGFFASKAVVAGNFNVELDGDISSVTIEGGSVGGSLTVTGTGGQKTLQISTTVGGDLTVNCPGAGDAYYFQNAPLARFQVNGKMNVTLDGDWMRIQNATVMTDVVVNGTGTVIIGNISIWRHFTANLSGDSQFSNVNYFSPTFSTIGGNFVLNQLSGNAAPEIKTLSVGRDFVFRGGAGNDVVKIEMVRAGGYTLVDTGAGNDVISIKNSTAVGGAAVLGGAGGDYLATNNFLCNASLYVDMAAGFDLVNISYSASDQSLAIAMGDDSDQVTVAVSRAKVLSINAGLGYDAVRVESSAVDQLFALLGDGGDSMAVITSLARVAAYLDGGPGFNLLQMRGNALTGLAYYNFQSVGA